MRKRVSTLNLVVSIAAYVVFMLLLPAALATSPWAYDHSGWNPEIELLAVNQAFEGHPLQRISIASSLAEFCEEHHHRMPDRYWRDPMPRAREYAAREKSPWR